MLVEALVAVEKAGNSLFHNNNLIIQNTVKAARGRVTYLLFLVKDFIKAYDLGENR